VDPPVAIVPPVPGLPPVPVVPPVATTVTQWSPAQVWLFAHWLSHEPQWNRLPLIDTQVPPQSTNPPVHMTGAPAAPPVPPGPVDALPPQDAPKPMNSNRANALM
jgi:hypothetical protein